MTLINTIKGDIYTHTHRYVYETYGRQHLNSC